MNASAAHTDYAAMGLAHYRPGQSAFEAVPPRGAQEKPYCGPKKTGPKPTKLQQAVMALETPEERKARHQRERNGLALDQQGRATVDLAPRKVGAITIHNKADTDRAAAAWEGDLA